MGNPRRLVSFSFPFPWPSSAFSTPVRWAAPPGSAAFGAVVPIAAASSPRARVNVFGYRLVVTGAIALAAAGGVVLSLFAGAVLLERIVHGLSPFRPAPAVGGTTFYQAPPGANVFARCDLVGGAPAPVAGDTFEARVLVWGFEEVGD